MNNGAGHHDVCCRRWVVKVMVVVGVVLLSETAGVARCKSAAELSETTLVLARHGRQCRVELNGVVSFRLICLSKEQVFVTTK